MGRLSPQPTQAGQQGAEPLLADLEAFQEALDGDAHVGHRARHRLSRDLEGGEALVGRLDSLGQLVPALAYLGQAVGHRLTRPVQTADEYLVNGLPRLLQAALDSRRGLVRRIPQSQNRGLDGLEGLI